MQGRKMPALINQTRSLNEAYISSAHMTSDFIARLQRGVAGISILLGQIHNRYDTIQSWTHFYLGRRTNDAEVESKARYAHNV